MKTKLTDKVNYSESLTSELTDTETKIINDLADLEPSCYADIAQFVIEYSSQQNTALMEENARLKETLEDIGKGKHSVYTCRLIAIEALKPKQ